MKAFFRIDHTLHQYNNIMVKKVTLLKVLKTFLHSDNLLNGTIQESGHPQIKVNLPHIHGALWQNSASVLIRLFFVNNYDYSHRLEGVKLEQ